MEVTKKNFAELLPVIKQSIDDCDFIAIDTELTGLYNSPSDEHAFDTTEERYMKIRDKCSKILITQLGISLFKYHPEDKKYTHKEFNFYVFPHNYIKQAPDPTFVCQSSSMHFLASHGFDFNKVIYEGIPYLTLADEEKIRKYLSEKHELERNELKQSLLPDQTPKTNGSKSVNIPDEHKSFIDDALKRVSSFMSDNSKTELNLEPCSAYRRKLIYEALEAQQYTGIDMSSKTTKDQQKYITISKCSESDKREILKTKQETDLAELDAAVGFRKVMIHLSQSGKLIIGHCMLLDIFHIIEQFFFPLPQELQEFKSMVRMTFPHLLDTKYMATSESLKTFWSSTALAKLHECMQSENFGLPDIESEERMGYPLDGEQYHEAGFDAFLAAVCFIGMAKKLGDLASPKVQYVSTSSKLISPYVNRPYILRHFDINCINLSGPDPEPNRENVFFVTFPQDKKHIDLVELFLPYGDVYVHWLSDTTALVALKSPQNTLKAKAGLLNKPSRIYQVIPYSEYRSWSLEQYNLKKVESSRSAFHPLDFKAGNKRRNSGSLEISGGCSMELIPEDDENEAETSCFSDLPPAKKLKPIIEENEAGEVSSTANVFDEENNW